MFQIKSFSAYIKCCVVIVSSPGTGLMQFSIRSNSEQIFLYRIYKYDLDSTWNIAHRMVPNVVSHIVLSLVLVQKQKTTFSWQNMVANISGGLPLPSADRYGVTSRERAENNDRT